MDAEDDNDCENNPNFAVICSFLLKFGDLCGIEKIDFIKLRQMIESKRKVPNEFIQFHIMLLRKMRNRHMLAEKWEMQLANVLDDFKIKNSAELRELGYKNISISLRLRILKFLLESQFDYNIKLRNRINKLKPVELKIEPIGRDIDGNLYWYQRDNNRNVRVYSENHDKSWNLISSNLKEGQVLIKKLKKRIGIISEECESEFAPENKKPKIDNEITESCANGISDVVEVVNKFEDPISNNQTDNGLKTEDVNGEISEKSMNGNDSNCETLNENKIINTDNNEMEFSETIEEPVIVIKGDGNGHDCDVGNPNIGINEENNSENSEKIIVDTTTEHEDIKDENVVNEDSKKFDSDNKDLKDLKNISENVSTVDVKKTENESTSPKLEPVDEELKEDLEEKKQLSPEKLNLNDNGSDDHNLNTTNEDVKLNVAKIEEKKNEVDVKEESEPPPRRKKGRPRKEKRPRNVIKSTSDGTKERKPRKPQTKRITMVEIEETDNEEEERQALLQKLSSNPDIVKKIRLMGLNLNDVDVLKSVSSILDDSVVDDRPIRQSRRLAQIKIKEVASTNEVVKKPSKKVNNIPVEKISKSVNKNSKKAKNLKTSPTYVISSSATNTEDDIDEDDEIIHDVEYYEPLVFKSDHEFSPESDLTSDEEYIPLRHARTACKATQEVTGYEDTACEKCNEKTNSEKILLCDKCDKGWHFDCITPPLCFVPAGDWFCPPCQHTMLIDKLEFEVDELGKIIKKYELEERRKERLAYVGISLSNVLPPPKKITKEEHHQSRRSHDDDDVDDDYDDDDYENSDDSAFETALIDSRESLASTPDSDSGSSRTNSSTGSRSKHKSYNGTDEDGSVSRSDKSSTSKSRHKNLKKSKKRIENYDDRSYRLRERRQTKANYVFNEYDNMIKSAIADEMKTVVKTSNDNRIDNETESEASKCNGIPEHKEEDDNNNNDNFDPPVTTINKQHKKKRRTFRDLDSNDEDDELGENDEEFEVDSESVESDELSASIGTAEEDDDDFINDSNDSDAISKQKRTVKNNKKGRKKKDYYRGFEGLRRSSRVRKTRYDFRGNLSSGSEEDVRPKKRRRSSSSDENSARNSDPDADLYNPQCYHQSKSKKIKFPRLEIPRTFGEIGSEIMDQQGAKKRKRILTRLSSSENDSEDKHSEIDKNSSSNSETDIDNGSDNHSYSETKNNQSNENDSNETTNAINVQKNNNLKSVTDDLSCVKNEYCSTTTPISAAKHLFSGTNIMQTAYTTLPQQPQQNSIILQTNSESEQKQIEDNVESHDEHHGEFGSLVSYFSSQSAEVLDS